jgi:hypothetical protein
MTVEPQVLKPSFVGRVVVQGLGSVEDPLASRVGEERGPRSLQIEATHRQQTVASGIVKRLDVEDKRSLMLPM